MNEIQFQIDNQLTEISDANGVSILFAVESGSRAWGFASEDSDYDVRFLYVRPQRDYLRIRPLRDVIELPLTGVLDTNGWDLVKALNLFATSNPALMEWLKSPIVYREEGGTAQALRDLAASHASPRRIGYHYLSMARRAFAEHIAGKEQVTLKKYLYALRPILCLRWIEQSSAPLPTAVDDVLKGISLPSDAAGELKGLLDRKRASKAESCFAEPIRLLDEFIMSEVERFEELTPTLADPRMDTEQLNRLFQRVIGFEDRVLARAASAEQ